MKRGRVAPSLGALAAVLCGCGAVVSAPESKGVPPLLTAAQSGNVAEIKRLIAAGEDPNLVSQVRFPSPLAAASVTPRNSEAIRALLAGGADPNGPRAQRGGCMVSPLTMAAYNDDESAENTRALLAGGADPNLPKCPPLVAGTMHVEVLRQLVAGGLRIHDVTPEGANALHLALSPGAMPRPEAVEYLIRSGVSLNARDKGGKTPLACWRQPHWPESRAWTEKVIYSLNTLIFGEAEMYAEIRARRAHITALLEQAGATL